jgi:hypothetical protein
METETHAMVEIFAFRRGYRDGDAGISDTPGSATDRLHGAGVCTCQQCVTSYLNGQDDGLKSDNFRYALMLLTGI